MRTLETYVEYEWTGTNDNMKYLCPKCHRPVHPGGWGRYFCDPCDESWFLEGKLEINPNGGWKRIDESIRTVEKKHYGGLDIYY